VQVTSQINCKPNWERKTLVLYRKRAGGIGRGASGNPRSARFRYSTNVLGTILTLGRKRPISSDLQRIETWPSFRGHSDYAAANVAEPMRFVCLVGKTWAGHL